MNNPLISIIIPVYNAEEYLPKCLNSIINQTYKNIEIICINDGSTDNSENIIKKYMEMDDRVIHLYCKNNGVSNARNVGLDIAKGRYIMFVDSDDWIEIETCDIVLKIAQEKNVDVVMWDYIREFNNTSIQKNIFINEVFFDEKKVKNDLHRRMIGITGDELSHPEKADALCTVWGKLYKRESIYKYNIRFFDIRLIGTYEDGLFNLNVFEHVRTAIYVHKPLYHYRKTNINSITNEYNKNLIRQHEKILDYMGQYIREKRLSNKYEVALNNRTALELVGYGLNILNGKSKKIKKINNILSDSRYRTAYKKMETQYMPIHWKAFYFFARHRITIGIYFMLIAIKTIKK